VSALWFIPHTHQLVIGGLLAVAVIALILSVVTFAVGRGRSRRARSQPAAMEQSVSFTRGLADHRRDDGGEPSRRE
jgi:hypothetical protein